MQAAPNHIQPPGPSQRPAGRHRKTRVAPVAEAAFWRPIRDGWRKLYGGFYDLGVSIEWQQFELPYPLDWSRSFHADSLELCLNLDGCGSIRSGHTILEFEPLTAGFYLPGSELQAQRDAKQRHRFITIEMSSPFVRDQLAACDGSLHPLVERFARGERSEAPVGEVHRLTVDQEQRARRLVAPPVPQGARALWYRGEVLQIMAELLFVREGADELFCDRQKRLARERTDGVIALLREHLVAPLSLEEIGRAVGCSPFHLSRTFSREMGISIPQYLRKMRMERAAELLRSGKYNVTEAALEVGYSSLSHFSQAFCQTMGCCPGLYPLKTVNASPGTREQPDHRNSKANSDAEA